ncbi:hypothetical protein ACFL0W_03450 [Nanoarchaeota archaeon]
MKHKTSVALEEDTIISIRELVRKGIFRNKSHAIEFSIKKLIEENKER